MTIPKAGQLFVISAPSGAGKSTLVKNLRQRLPQLQYSISYTTRAPRPNEVNGRDYHFISAVEFECMTAQDQLLEWANVHGNYYGTGRDYVCGEMAQGRSILLEIDVEGAKQIMHKKFACTTIFIMPPSLQVLEQRLIARGDISAVDLKVRLQNAVTEIAQKDLYQHIIVNDALATAQNELYRIVAEVLNA